MNEASQAKQQEAAQSESQGQQAGAPPAAEATVTDEPEQQQTDVTEAKMTEADKTGAVDNEDEEEEDIDIEMNNDANDVKSDTTITSDVATDATAAAASNDVNATDAKTTAAVATETEAENKAIETQESEATGLDSSAANEVNNDKQEIDIEDTAMTKELNQADNNTNQQDIEMSSKSNESEEAAKATTTNIFKEIPRSDSPAISSNYAVTIPAAYEEHISNLPWIWRQCYKLLLLFKQIRQSVYFLEPVTEELVPGYRTIIKKPMDLGTIEEKMLNSKYKFTNDAKVYDFMRDMQLIWKNAMQFNRTNTIYYASAALLADTFRRMFARIEYDWKLRDGRLAKYAADRKIRGGSNQFELTCDRETLIEALLTPNIANSESVEKIAVSCGFNKQTLLIISNVEQKQKFATEIMPQLSDHEMGLLVEILDKKCPFSLTPILEPLEMDESGTNTKEKENNNNNNENSNDNNENMEEKKHEFLYEVSYSCNFEIDVGYIDSVTINDLFAWAKDRIENRAFYMKPPKSNVSSQINNNNNDNTVVSNEQQS